MRLAIVGAGAIGGTLGAYLVRAGHEVTFVDAAADHVAAINESGLRITGPIEEFTVRAPAYVPAEVPGQFEVILLCVKAHATEQATRDLLPFLADDGYVASIQNGLNEAVIASIIGEERTLGCFVNFGADYLEPRVLHYGGRGGLVLGELDGADTDRLRELHELVQIFEPAAQTTGNIWGYLWSKLAVGSMIFATALTDTGIADCYALPQYRLLFSAIASEALAVALAFDVKPEPFDGFNPLAFLPGTAPEVTSQSLDEMVAFNRRSAKTHSGVWRDLAVRKRKTEADAQLGPIVEHARSASLSAPLVSQIISMIHEVEAGLRERSLDNLTELEKLRASAAESVVSS